MIEKKQALLLALLSIYSFTSASEVWGSRNERLEDQSQTINGLVNEYSGYILPADANSIRSIQEINSNSTNRKERVDALWDSVKEGSDVNSFNIYAEYLYMKKHFVEGPNQKGLSHHYPFVKKTSQDVLPSAAKKIRSHLENIYYPSKSQDSLIEALAPETVKKNQGKIIYQSGDPKNQINFDEELKLGRSTGQSFSDYLGERSSNLAKQYGGMLITKRLSKEFDGVIAKLESHFAEQLADLAISKAAGYNAFASVRPWVPSCRTVMCFAGGGMTTPECSMQITTFNTVTQGVTPADTAAKKAAWLLICPMAVAGGENSLQYVKDGLSSAQKIFNFGSNNSGSGGGNEQPSLDLSALGMDASSLDNQDTAARSLIDYNKIIVQDIELHCRKEVYNARSRTIRFNWFKPTSTSNRVDNPFHIIEAIVKDDQLAKRCQEYVDHSYTTTYATPIYHRWVLPSGYNSPAINRNQIFKNKWLSKEALSYYESNIIRTNNNSSGRKDKKISAREVFGTYYKDVPDSVIKSVDGLDKNRLLLMIREVKSKPTKLNQLADSYSFEHFATSGELDKQPVFDLEKGQYYYFGEWRLVPEYVNEGTLINDPDYNWNVKAIKQEVQNYGRETDTNNAESANAQRERNKQIMQQELNAYKVENNEQE